MSQLTIQQAFAQGLQHHQAGRLADAERLYRMILAAQPAHAETLHLLGLIAHQMGRSDDAIALIRQALSIKPAFPEALSNLGMVLSQRGQFDEAIGAYQRAVALKPDFADAHYNLGLALHHQLRFDEAVGAFRNAIASRPTFADAYNDLGNVLEEKGQFDEAIAAFQRALALRPTFAEAYSNLGNAFKGKGSLDEAAGAYRQALALNPNLAEVHNNLGLVLSHMGRLDESIACNRRVMELEPARVLAHSAVLWALNYHPAYDALAIAQELRRFEQQHAEPLRKLIQPHHNDRDSERRLRIGYVSADFCEHATAFFHVPLFENHDKLQVEVFCYANVLRPDGVTRRVRQHADHWRETLAMTDDAVAQQIRDDRIDILVDLQLHTDSNRLLIFARKPAPVQVTWLGYPGSTGLSAIDYRLTDPQLDPPGVNEPRYAEEPWRLPHCFWCFDPQMEEPAVGPPPALRNGFVTFGCLNNFCKVNEGVLALWARLLVALPGSRLHLLAHEGSHRQRTIDFLARQGVATERVQFRPYRPRLKYLELYHEIDICLDTFPYNGHTTGFDSYWMGVPVVTLVGQMAAGRAGLTLATNMSLPEMAAATAEEFVARATALAGDLTKLQALRARLRPRMKQSPLMDTRQFARDIEAAYRAMWRKWCANSGT